MLLEQNAVPGLTNRLLAHVVSAAAVTFASTVSFFGRRAFVAGNPIRQEFVAAAARKTGVGDGASGAAPRVLIFGGSQGAHAINMAMVEAAPRLADGRLAVTHQTGERDLESVRAAYRKAGLDARVEPFLYEMDREMTAADVVVCRAGATTLAELTAAGKPAVLIPLPTAADDHQRKNAEVLVGAGAAEMIEQKDLSGEAIAGRIAALVADAPRRERMATAARAFARPDAARVIVDRALELAGRERGEPHDRQTPSFAAAPESWMLGRTRRVHFVGIGGIGMSGIAELLANLGYEVTGSDARESDVTQRLAQLGVGVQLGHDAAHVGAAEVVVVSSAIAAANPEIVEARRRRIPVIPRAEMLAELMRLRFGIAIAGAHGKTTTTSMVALVLERAGLDPTAVIGGRLSAFGSNARLGRGQSMVVEADESDRSFLKLSPALALVTNIDREHMEAYGSWEALNDAFVEFINKVPFYGAAILCTDDDAVRALVPRAIRRVITYGLAGESHPDVAGRDMQLEPFGARCTVVQSVEGQEVELGPLRLQVPGRHNLLNALGAVAIGLELQVPFRRIAEALGEFSGAERRFQVRGERRGVMVVDDYGHHPTEIAAVIAAARSTGRRLMVVFQPHRYTRTRDLLAEFGTALSGADEVVLTDIYPAGEPPLAGVTVDSVAESVRAAGHCPLHVVPNLADLPGRVASLAKPGDLVITLGAGSIGAVGDRILTALASGDASGGATCQ